MGFLQRISHRNHFDEVPVWKLLPRSLEESSQVAGPELGFIRRWHPLSSQHTDSIQRGSSMVSHIAGCHGRLWDDRDCLASSASSKAQVGLPPIPSPPFFRRPRLFRPSSVFGIDMSLLINVAFLARATLHWQRAPTPARGAWTWVAPLQGDL